MEEFSNMKEVLWENVEVGKNYLIQFYGFSFDHLIYRARVLYNTDKETDNPQP